MPANPTSVQEARANVYLDRTMSTDADLDALVAAVRAERDAEILRVVERMKAVYPPSLQREATLDAVLAILSDREGA